MKGKKTGGRQAGTPNKVSGVVRELLSGAVEDYFSSDQFSKDLLKVKPVDRLYIMEKLSSYVVPKLQNTTLDVETETKKTIEDRLVQMSAVAQAKENKKV